MINHTLNGIAIVATLVGVCFAFSPGRAAHAEDDNEATQRGGLDAGTIYAKSCATCHGKDGRAKTLKARFNNARNLTDAEWQADVSDERLYNSISNGRGKMPPFRKRFSEDEINGLVAYVRRLKK
jgi:mono/diheme cytochrome c family protein